MASKYGVDYSTYPKIDLTFKTLSENEMILQEHLRRLSTPAGDLFWDAAGTIDLTLLLNDDLSSDDIAFYETYLPTLFEDDPRTVSVFTITFNGEKLIVSELITKQDGTSFTAIYTVDSNQITVKKED